MLDGLLGVRSEHAAFDQAPQTLQGRGYDLYAIVALREAIPRVLYHADVEHESCADLYGWGSDSSVGEVKYRQILAHESDISFPLFDVMY